MMWHIKIIYTKVLYISLTVIRSSMSDCNDVTYKKHIYKSSVYKLNCHFAFASSATKTKLLQTYCSAWYGSQNWQCNTESVCDFDPLRWRHNDHAGVSNHQPHGCLLNRLFRRKSKKTSTLRVTGLCAGNSPEISRTNGQLRGKCFHLMTSSCHTEWSKAVRRTLCLPALTRSRLLPHLANNQSCTAQIEYRGSSLINACYPVSMTRCHT